MHTNHKAGQLDGPLGPGMQHTPAPVHMRPHEMVEGGQLGLGVGRTVGGQLSLHGGQVTQGQLLDLHSLPWRAPQPGSQAQLGLHVQQQSQQDEQQQQQPWHSSQTSNQVQPGLQMQQPPPPTVPKQPWHTVAHGSQIQSDLQPHSQQQQQLPGAAVQQHQQRFPPPPPTVANIPAHPGAGGPLNANATAAAPPKVAQILWDRNAGTDPSKQQQPNQQQQAGQQQQQRHLAQPQLLAMQPPQSMRQHLPGPPQLQGHVHIPVLQLAQLSPQGTNGGGFLQLDRLEPPQPSSTPPLPVHAHEPSYATSAGRTGAPGNLAPPPPPKSAAAQPPPPPSMQRPGGMMQTSAMSPLPHGLVVTGPPSARLQPLVLIGAHPPAGGVGGAPSSAMMQPVAHLLQREAGNLQNLLKVLQNLSKQQQGNCLPNLTVQDGALASELLAVAVQTPEQQKLIQQHAQGKQKPLDKHPGVQFFCQWMQTILPLMETQQQLQLLDTLASLAQAGLGTIHQALIEATLTLLAESGALEQPDVFLAAAAAVPALSGTTNSSHSNAEGAAAGTGSHAPGLSVLLAEQLLKKLMREDADVGCRVVLEVLIGLHEGSVAIPPKLQDGVSKVLQDHLPSFTPPQLAALLACHAQLGLDNYSKLLRKTAAEYLKRPVAGASVELLLGVMGGLAAGGSTTLKEVPAQLLAKMSDELQPLLASCSCEHLLTACRVLAQIGCLKANSPKQQQLVDALQQQLKRCHLQPDIWLAMPEMIHVLQELSGQQHQAGLVSLIKEATAIQDSQVTAVRQAVQQQPADVLKLVAGLQLREQLLENHSEAVKEPLLLAMKQLCGAVAAEQQDVSTASVAAAASEPLRSSLSDFTLSELTALVQAVIKLYPAPTSTLTAADEAAGPGAVVALLLQALLQTEVLLHKQVPAAAVTAAGQTQEQQQQQQQRAGNPLPPPAPGAPPPPPPGAAAAAPPPPPPAAAAASGELGGDAAGSGADTPGVFAPVVFIEEDWASLAQLLHACVQWYPLDTLPAQVVQLVLEVVEAQAAIGSVINCTADAAVALLWGLAIAGALMLELWDALAIALDKPGVGLGEAQLQQVFEAYCLVVLRLSGPYPRPVPAGQLAAAGAAYWEAVVSPVAAARSQLQQALCAAGVLQPGGVLTAPSDGHLMLFDVVITESQQAWVLAGSRSALATSAAELLLARYGWTCVNVSAAQLNPAGATNPNPASSATQLQQLAQVSQLLPRLVALLSVQQQQQASILPDASALAGLSKLVMHLKTSIRQGTLLAALPPAQMNTLRQIADMYKGEIVRQPIGLPPFGRARLQRLQQQEAAAARDSEVPESEEDVGMDYDENAMDAEDMFIHNRLWLYVEDPWWFCHRLLVQEGPNGASGTPTTAAAAAANPMFGAAAAATAAAAAGQTPPSAAESLRLAREVAESQRIAREAAAAALVVRAHWAQQEAAAAAAAAAARAAAGLPPLEDDIMQGAGKSAAAVATGDGHGLERDRSIEQWPKRRRHWRESRSRSRSCSVDSGIDSSTHDGNKSSKGGGRDSEASGESRSSSSESEEGAISTDSEEGEVAVTPKSRAATLLEAQQRREAERQVSKGTNAAAAPMPVSFAARGVIAKGKASWRQKQPQQGARLKLRRGRSSRSRSRSSSRSSSRSRSRSSSRSSSRGWHYGSRRAGSRSRSPAALRRGRIRLRSPSDSRSESPQGRGWAGRHARAGSHSLDRQQLYQHYNQQYEEQYDDTLAADAAGTTVGGTPTKQQRMLAAAIAAAQQAQHQQSRPQQQALAAAAAAAIAKQHQQQQVAQQRQQSLQQQAAGQLKRRAAWAALAPWIPKFGHLPKSQEKLANMLEGKLIHPSDFTDTGVAAATQLSDDALLQVLDELSTASFDRKAKELALKQAVQAEEAAGIVNGPAMQKWKKQKKQNASHKHGDRTALMNGQLVQLCRKHGANVLPRKARVEALLNHWDDSVHRVAGFGSLGWGGLSVESAASGDSAGAAVVATAAAAAAKPARPVAAPTGPIGYMYVNGMLVPVAANAASGFALGGFAGGYGVAAVAGNASAKAAFSGKGNANPGLGNKKATAFASAIPGGGGAAAGSSGGVAASKGGGDAAGSGGSGGGGTQSVAEPAGAANKGGKMMSQYWQALCSGLGADGDEFSDVEDEPGEHKAGRDGKGGASQKKQQAQTGQQR